jgi:Ca-activated chloride channel family protein
VRGRAGLLAGLLLLGASADSARADPAASKNNEGNRLYEQKRFDEALKMYTDAQASRPGAPELHYNIGNVLYRKGEFDKALEEYLRAQGASGPALSQASIYNRANALLQQGKVQDAVNAYVQALRSRPDDADAKRNLEIALRRLKEQQQKNPQPKPDEQNQPKPPQQNPQGAPPQPKPGQTPNAPPKPRPGQMSEEEARRILDALRDAEREEIKKHLQAAAGDERPPEEDW